MKKNLLILSFFIVQFQGILPIGHRWEHIGDECICPHIEAIVKYFKAENIKNLKLVLGAGDSKHDYEYDDTDGFGPRFPGYNFLVSLGIPNERLLFTPTDECKKKSDIRGEIDLAYQKLAKQTPGQQHPPIGLRLDFTKIEKGFGQFCQELKGQFKEITFDYGVIHIIERGIFGKENIECISLALCDGGKFYIDSHPGRNIVIGDETHLEKVLSNDKHLKHDNLNNITYQNEPFTNFFIGRFSISKNLININSDSRYAFDENLMFWIFPSKEIRISHMKNFLKNSGFGNNGDSIEHFSTGYPLPSIGFYNFSNFEYIVATKSTTFKNDLINLKNQPAILKNKLIFLNEKLITLKKKFNG